MKSISPALAGGFLTTGPPGNHQGFIQAASVMSKSSATLRTVACQAPLSEGFSRQEYWSGLPFPPPGGLPDPGIEPASPALQVDSLLLNHQGSPLRFSYEY